MNAKFVTTVLLSICCLIAPTCVYAITYSESTYYDSCAASTNECSENNQEETNIPPTGDGSNLLSKYIRLTSPNGGETLGRQSSDLVYPVELSLQGIHRVTWESLTYGIESVDVLYSLDSGKSYREIASHLPNSGFYDWTLPNINADQVMLRVNAYGADDVNLGSDYSNAPFSLLNYIPSPLPGEFDSEFQQAILVDQKIVDNPIHVNEEFEVDVVYYNNGNTTWYKFTDNPVVLGGYMPEDRNSVFASSGWLSENRPAMLSENLVVPGEAGTFRFTMKAPSAPGDYHEIFAPVIEGKMWLATPVVFDINVVS